MVKYRYSGRVVLFLLFLIFNFSVSVSAHEGHDQNDETVITIGKKSYIHFQAVLMGYQYIYSYMVKGGASEISSLAQNVIDAANLGIQSEPEGPGQHMMQHILEGSEALKNAKDVNGRREAFASISNALFPFFKQWPNQLMRSRLKMCRCKSGHEWLQPDNCSTVCPYSQKKSSSCLMIEETKY
ncbi:hypothetical protein BIY37_12610 [Candidatus Brocadia sapporoensis]|uniref:DUF3347 domain-containing protein n=1 Tax=Candidatus Brocadia sapporoensis TaxID=392547 RepID=A0A1V6LWY6_9BACT|nr:hypothetical protein [Candidatus Brocadia sapporoensis]MDG6004625.1 hypothetical protein [Candidatus Brocadia sp.]OQD44646.1 hypothetical protein BIY37_12610 [Candidatus Brocadia sapporoensis]GJQ23123.1 MAG: hypothetical protein HBSAPP01_09130 [Candidatus Brocadia sapporoensis]